jgi:hypothetical protein
MRACASLSSLPLLLPIVSHTSVIRHRPLLLEIECVAHARHSGTAVGRDTVGAPPASRGQALCRMASSPWTPPFPLCHMPEHSQKPSAVVPLPFSPRFFAPALKHAATSPSFPELAHRPRTPGPRFSPLISPEMLPPSAFTSELLATLRLALLDPHLILLSLSPWCRTRAASLVTTVPAPPPPNATAQHCPTAPPMHSYWGEPRLHSPCSAPPPLLA